MKQNPNKPHAALTLGTLFRFTLAAVVVAAVLLTAFYSAHAQERGGNFLDNLFNRGDGQQQQQQPDQGGQPSGGDPNDLAVRIDRIESALRQLTGTIEQLQYRNQQLEQQVRALQGGGAPAPGQPPVVLPNNQNPVVAPGQQPVVRPGVPGALQPSTPAQPGRRSDVFDPSLNPQAPGAPRPLGATAAAVPPLGTDAQANAPVGAPDGRAAGAPLDLSTLSGNQPPPSSPVVDAGPAPGRVASAGPVAPPAAPSTNPPRDVAAGARLATLPPSAKPQDEYDLAYGYVLHKDYGLAEQAFRDFLRKYPNEALVADAQYWLGESLFQRQRYRDAAESFLAVSTKFEKAGKAPNALLRLGQSLAALKQKEAACATLAEVSRKYPKAPVNVKKGVEEEIKRAKC
ncbi:MAG: tol-pal system protein YbgF [Pseudolabrys sp.]|jgi:tol-pal system protein YbgF